MTKIKLKYAIPELGGGLYEVKLNLPRQEEMTETKRSREKRPGQPKAKATGAQIAQRQRFALVHEYARAALANPTLRAYYEELAEKEGRSPYALARADYFKGNDLLSSWDKVVEFPQYLTSKDFEIISKSFLLSIINLSGHSIKPTRMDGLANVTFSAARRSIPSGPKR